MRGSRVAPVLAASLIMCPIGVGAQRSDVPLVDLFARAQADSNDPVMQYDLAVGLVRARRGDEAIRALETAIAIDRELAPAYALLGRLRLGRAPAAYVAVLAPDASNRIRLVLLRPGSGLDTTGRILRRAFMLDPLQEIEPVDINDLPVVWRGTLSRALRLFRQGQVDRAAALFDSVIVVSDRRNKPPPPVALWYHALAASASGRFPRAIVDVRRMLDGAQRDSTPAAEVASRNLRYALAVLHLRSGDHAEAERLFRQVSEEDLGLDGPHEHLARMYESDQRWSDAARERRYALNITPDDPTQMFRLGMDLLQVGLTQEANATFRRALEISPRETRAYYGLGIAATGLGDVSAARDAFTRFLALAPSRDSALAADTRRRLEELAP